jgi:Protein of unknown function (DUF1153)
MMANAAHMDAKFVIGPYGHRLSAADLPQPGTRRWVIRRKAEIVAAVQGGLISLEDACSRYALTVEEFLVWQHSVDNHGLNGLRMMRDKHYRRRALWMRLRSRGDRASSSAPASPDDRIGSISAIEPAVLAGRSPLPLVMRDCMELI